MLMSNGWCKCILPVHAKKNLGPVVQRLDNAIHWINHWIVIYPVDSIVQFSNNLGPVIQSVITQTNDKERAAGIRLAFLK